MLGGCKGGPRQTMRFSREFEMMSRAGAVYPSCAEGGTDGKQVVNDW